MIPKSLNEAFDPVMFKSFGTELVDLLSSYLDHAQANKIPITKHIDPNEEFKFWSTKFAMDDHETKDPLELIQTVIDRSIHIHHPHYIGHQVATTAPLAALTNVVSALLNNGMAIYEMGAAASAIEKLVTEHMCSKFGFENGTGIMTSGGTLANLTAMLAARAKMVQADVWKDGHQDEYVVLASEEAHYCIDRALRIMGFGEKGIIKIKANRNFKMSIRDVEDEYNKQLTQGKKVMAIVASAPSTSTGTFENLKDISQFCKNTNCWFHVDAAHGGAAIFSKKYKHLLDGIHEADSIVIDAHKMMLTPALMTFLLFRENKDSYQTFSQKAQYLWSDDQSEEWYNYGKRTFECTKQMMAMKFLVLQRTYGDQLFEDYVTHQFDLAQEFANILKEKEDFELAVEVESNIVCFRYIDRKHDLNPLNTFIRKSVFEKGIFYIVQTKLKGEVYLRLTIMNHLTNKNIFKNLLEEIQSIGRSYTKNNS